MNKDRRKAGLVHNYASIALTELAAVVTPYLGWLEIVLVVILARRRGAALDPSRKDLTHAHGS